jgi:post-segregation antitoxin (ccd killing protein)
MTGEKAHTTLYLDKNVVKRAKEIGLNISKTCENALIEAIRRLEGSVYSEKPFTSEFNRDRLVARAGFEPASTAPKAAIQGA